MNKSKYSFLKQWFTFTYNHDKSTELLYSFTNNHYIHTWFEQNGHTEFENILNLKKYDLFIQAINESTNMIPDDFDTYFPDYFIEDYSLWNMETDNYWGSIHSYREHCKNEMETLFEVLWDKNDDIEQNRGVLKYCIYYNH